MMMYEISKFIKRNPDAIVQFMTTNSFSDCPFTYCCTARELYDDWMNEADYCPRNGEVILMCTFYVDDKAYPIERIGLDECSDFEDLMMRIEKGLK